jgi:hypothetical protein
MDKKMNKLIIFLVIVFIAIIVVWPGVPKEGFTKLKQDATIEFNAHK